MGITHAKVSAKADGGDATLVLPSDWNAAHVAALNDLSDLNAGSPSDQNVLTWDNGTSKWIAQAPAGLTHPQVLARSLGA